MRGCQVKAFQNAGFEVTSYDNGLSAYHRLREEPFELLLTDIVMPEMDGIELARRAAELDPDIKIMFITGFAAVARNPDCTPRRGRPRFCPSPFHLRELVNEVQKMLARRSQRADTRSTNVFGEREFPANRVFSREMHARALFRLVAPHYSSARS